MRPKICLLLVASALLAATCPADEDDLDQAWPSPNRKYLVRHTITFDQKKVTQRKQEDVYDQLAAYVLSREGKVLWQMESPVDESAHSFRCVWAPGSKSAIVLDRPARGDVEIGLILTERPAKSGRLALQHVIDRVIKKAGEDDAVRYLQKAWFGQWRYAAGHFEGIVIVAKVHYHRLHLVLVPSARKPKLKLVDTVTSEKWDDHLEAL